MVIKRGEYTDYSVTREYPCMERSLRSNKRQPCIGEYAIAFSIATTTQNLVQRQSIETNGHAEVGTFRVRARTQQRLRLAYSLERRWKEKRNISSRFKTAISYRAVLREGANSPSIQ